MANPFHNRIGKLTLVRQQLNHLVDFVFSFPFISFSSLHIILLVFAQLATTTVEIRETEEALHEITLLYSGSISQSQRAVSAIQTVHDIQNKRGD